MKNEAVLKVKMQKSKGLKENFWKRRYNIALHGFLVYFLISAHRINLSVAIVDMVDLSHHENISIYQNTSALGKNSSKLWHEQASDIVKYDWSPKIQGYILGAGFVGVVISLIAGGKLAETIGPKISLFLGTFISSFTTTVTPLAASVNPYFVVFIQCIRGISQGVLVPAITVLSANWFPSSERGLLSGLSISGGVLGLLVPGFVSSLICDSVSIGGWPTSFYTFGGFGILLSFLQIISLTSLPKDDPKISKAELKYILENQETKLTLKRPAVPWGKILCSMPTHALLVGLFGQYWLLLHFLSVHAIFLATVLHYPITENGALISYPYILSMIFHVLSAFLSSFFSKKSYLSISKIRKMWNLIGCLIYSTCLALLIFTNSENTVTIVCTTFGIGSIGFMGTGAMLVPLDMTPTFSGSLMGFSMTIGSCAGFILPVVSGFLTNEEQTVQQWNKFFIISIVVVMSSAIFFCVFGSAEIQNYNYCAQDLSPKTEEKAKNDAREVELKDTSDFSNHI